MKEHQNQGNPSIKSQSASKALPPLGSWPIFWLVFVILVVIIAIISNVLFHYIKPVLFQPDYAFTPEFSPPDFFAQLSKYQAMWESKKITHYRMLLSLPYASNGFGRLSDPLSVEVQAGIVISVVDADGNKVLLTQDEFASASDQKLLTVSGLFDFLNEIYAEKPVSLRVLYDPVFGYPSSIDVNPYMEPCCQEYSVFIDDFQVISR